VNQSASLREQLGGIDIYLLDQILKGTFDESRSVLDVGCGGGRNLIYFLRHGFDVYAIDRDPRAVASVTQLVSRLAPTAPPDRLQIAEATGIPFSDESMDVVLSNAVLHFAEDEDHFSAMVRELWRLLAPGGYLFARLASSIGLERVPEPVGNGRYVLPDGSTRFLVDEGMLLRWTDELSGQLAEPLKTSNVQNLRCMTTWCVRK